MPLQVLSGHARKTGVDVDDVKLAVSMYAEQNLTSAPSRETLLEMARVKNNQPLPPPRKANGMRLPPERHCLTACNYRLKFKGGKGGGRGGAGASRAGAAAAANSITMPTSAGGGRKQAAAAGGEKGADRGIEEIQEGRMFSSGYRTLKFNSFVQSPTQYEALTNGVK